VDRLHPVLSCLRTIKSHAVASSHELMCCVAKAWCWEGRGRNVGESPSHPQSHSPSAQTTTADIRRNKDHVFNDARMILTQRQWDFYVQRERNLALVCGSAASCISMNNRFCQQVQQIQSQHFSIVFNTRPVRTLAWPPAVTEVVPLRCPKQSRARQLHPTLPSYHAILQVLTPGLNTN